MSLTEEKNADIIKKVVERKDRILRGGAHENILNNFRMRKMQEIRKERLSW